MTHAIAAAKSIIIETLRPGRNTLAEVRDNLDGIGRVAQDRALLDLQADGFLVLYRNDNTVGLTDADRKAEMLIAGFPRHIAYKL